MSEFYPENIYLNDEQIDELASKESIGLTENSLVYATRILPNGTYKPTVEIEENGYGVQNVYIIYEPSLEAGLMVLNQRLIIIEPSNGHEDIRLLVTYPEYSPSKPN